MHKILLFLVSTCWAQEIFQNTLDSSLVITAGTFAGCLIDACRNCIKCDQLEKKMRDNFLQELPKTKNIIDTIFRENQDPSTIRTFISALESQLQHGYKLTEGQKKLINEALTNYYTDNNYKDFYFNITTTLLIPQSKEDLKKWALLDERRKTARYFGNRLFWIGCGLGVIKLTQVVYNWCNQDLQEKKSYSY